MIQVHPMFFRLSGWALLLGGLMGAAGQAVHAPDVPGSVAEIPRFLDIAVNVHVLLVFSSALILMGLGGLFLRQAGRLRWWGWLALPLLFIGLLLEILHGPVQIISYPMLFNGVTTPEQLHALSDQIENMPFMESYPWAMLIFIPIVPFLLTGLLLLGLSALTSGVLPKGPAFLVFAVLVVLILGTFITLPLFDHVFALVHLVFVCFGAALAFEKKQALQVPSQGIRA